MSYIKLFIQGRFTAKRKINLRKKADNMTFRQLGDINEEIIRKKKVKLISEFKEDITRAGSDFRILFTL